MDNNTTNNNISQIFNVEPISIFSTERDFNDSTFVPGFDFVASEDLSNEGGGGGSSSSFAGLIQPSTEVLNNVTDLTAVCSQFCSDTCAFNTTPLNIVYDTGEMQTWRIVVILVPVILVSLTIILGNLLVIVAVFTQKSLRSPQNMYIVSLAIADMTVALLVLPLNITTLLFDGVWRMGDDLCKMYLIADVSLCTASILHLCAIAIDRYRAINDGINYIQKRNIKSVLWITASIWIVSFWIGTEPILGWTITDTPVGKFCWLPNDFGHAIHLAIGALFFPLCVMAFLYFKIYGAIKERLQERAKVNCIELTSDYDSDRIEPNSTSTGSTLEKKGTGTLGKRKVSAQISTFLSTKQKFSLSRERKAARTLGLIMGAFIICWLPLGFLNTISALLPESYQPHEAVFQFFTWLGYVNSGLNPIIYAASNQEFQKGFKRVLKI